MRSRKNTLKRSVAAVIALIMVMSCVMSQIALASDTEQGESKVITAFGETETEVEIEKGTLEEAVRSLPQEMEITTADGMNSVIEAVWECTDDYEGTEYELYTFHLVLPEGYTLGGELTEWDIPYIDVSITGMENERARILYDPNPDGTVTLDVALGAAGNIVSWLESHENDGYYLGTPYIGLNDDIESCLRPNGEFGGSGQMNCTGFVGSVLRHEGADLTKISTRLPGHYANASNWNDFVANNSIKSYRYSSISEALASGVLKKGDIIYFEPNNWSEPDADCHIGFFWGDISNENKFWHSSTHPGRGNQISEIVAKTADSSLYVFPIQHTGKLNLKKTSANTGITEGNACYSLQDAVYGVYTEAACTNKVAELTTDADGNSNTVELTAGTYWIREVTASKGYLLDEKTYSVTVNSGNTAYIEVEEEPGNDPAAITLYKIDQETDSALVQGAASLEGAQFQINFYDGFYDSTDELPDKVTRSWIIGTKAITYPDKSVHYVCKLSNEYMISGDEFYYMSGNPDPTLPLGTITVEEIKAPIGYILDGAYLQAVGSEEKIEGIYLSQITQEGNLVRLNGGNEYSISDRVIRGDFEFTKKDEESKESMSGIPFKITSTTTGESHTVTTDENGYFSSSAEYTKHTVNTNGGKAGDGLWFGLDTDGKMIPANDAYGALPYDTYIIEEQHCAANEGKALYKGTLTVSRDGYQIDLGTIENPDLMISSSAKDEKTGTRYAIAEEETTTIDAVSYTGLAKGKEYRLVTTLWNRKEETLVLDEEGNPVSAEQKFTPKTAEGRVETEVTYDASALAGNDMVVYEELYLGEELVAEHKDPNDSAQTIHFPKLATMAIDKATGTNVANAEETVNIVDTVSYSNVPAGKKVKFTGVAVDAETGKEVLDADGERITAAVTVTPEQSSGTVEVPFTFNGSNLAGKTIVFFETMERNDKTYAEHKDLEDEAQTVYFPEIHTEAADARTGTKNVLASGDVRMTDTVSYANVKPGEPLVIKGVPMNQNTGEAVRAKTGTVVKEGTIIPEEAEVYTLSEGDFCYVAEGSETVGAGMYHATKKGYIAYDERDTEPITIADELISWTGKFEKETKVYVLDEEVKEIIEPEYEYTEEKNEVAAEVTFIPETTEGTVEVEFIFDGSELAGETLVVYEELYLKDKLIAEHKDIEDEAQTVYFPKIETEATDIETGTHTAVVSDKNGIADMVSYHNLIPGQPYEIRGVAMIKETEEALIQDGKEITAEAVFTPTEKNGTVKVEFTFNGSELDGKTLVVFEELYLNGELVAEHKDIEDEAQSVTLKKQSSAPKTGLTSRRNLYLLIAGLLLAAAIAAVYLQKRSPKMDDAIEDLKI